MKRYKITEIFQSIQGEGSYAGTLAIFIRFAGCNMNCSFCDTDFKVKEFLTAEQIFERVGHYNSTIVVFTGGEPMLQVDEELMSWFENYKVHIETNGTIDIFQEMDHIVVSPKDPFNWNQKTGNDLKILIGKDDDTIPLWIIEADTTFDNYYLQPIMGDDYLLALDNCIHLITYNPKWRLSLQLHKIIDVR